MGIKPKHPPEDTRPRYKGICPVCGATLYICKSIAQASGLGNIGHGTCYQCETFLHLEFNEEKQQFDCEAWEAFMDRQWKNGANTVSRE